LDSDIVLEVDSVSKVFCRDFKRSLLYGLLDITNELLPISNNKEPRKKEFLALKEVSFHLKKGECLGLIGSNGSGKSTILRIINRLYKPDAGEVQIKGNVAALIALGTGFNPLLTGRENIYINGAILGIPKNIVKEKEAEIIEFSGIESFIDTPIRSYSSGMVVRLGFAVASILRPQILILDEVLAVGDITFQHKCLAQINRIKESGTSTILVSHNMYHIKQYADRCIWLDDGKVRLSGDTNYVTQQYLNFMSKSTSLSDFNGNFNSSIYGTLIPLSSKVRSGKVKIQQSRNKQHEVKLSYEFFLNSIIPLEITTNIYQENGQKISVINSHQDNVDLQITVNRMVEGRIDIDCSNLCHGKYIAVFVLMSGGEFLLRKKLDEIVIESPSYNPLFESVINLPRIWNN
jgi:lipopolysaccharide transport system ATP-binding protein